MPTLQQQLNYMRKQKAFAWAKYYEAILETHTGNVAHYNTINNVVEEVSELPVHMVEEYKQMLKDLHREIECPICMEIINELKITYCGHKYCNKCFEKIDECAMCRRKIKKN